MLQQWHNKFSCHKSEAKRRDIPFLLTFEEWFKIWKESGHIKQRGNKRGLYVMARFGDRGPYAVGNVRIILFEDNSRERRLSLEAKARIGVAHTGKFVSAATRKKISRKAKGRVPSSEVIEKFRAAAVIVSRRRSRNEMGQFTGIMGE